MPAKNHHQFVFPDDSRWDDARQAWNLAADLRPTSPRSEWRSAGRDRPDAIGAEASPGSRASKASVDPGGLFRSGHRFATATVVATEEALAA